MSSHWREFRLVRFVVRVYFLWHIVASSVGPQLYCLTNRESIRKKRGAQRSTVIVSVSDRRVEGLQVYKQLLWYTELSEWYVMNRYANWLIYPLILHNNQIFIWYIHLSLRLLSKLIVLIETINIITIIAPITLHTTNKPNRNANRPPTTTTNHNHDQHDPIDQSNPPSTHPFTATPTLERVRDVLPRDQHRSTPNDRPVGAMCPSWFGWLGTDRLDDGPIVFVRACAFLCVRLCRKCLRLCCICGCVCIVRLCVCVCSRVGPRSELWNIEPVVPRAMLNGAHWHANQNQPPNRTKCNIDNNIDNNNIPNTKPKKNNNTTHDARRQYSPVAYPRLLTWLELGQNMAAPWRTKEGEGESKSYASKSKQPNSHN